MYILGYLKKVEQTILGYVHQGYQTSASRLGWNDSVMKQIEETVSFLVRKGKSDEKLLINKYRKLYEKLSH